MDWLVETFRAQYGYDDIGRGARSIAPGCRDASEAAKPAPKK